MLFSKNAEDILARARKEKVTIQLEDQDTLDKLSMIDLTAYDLQLLKVMKPYVEKEIATIARDFYASFYQIDSLKRIIDTYSSVDKLSRTLAVHVVGLFSGVIDPPFMERRTAVGRVHYKIGLTPSYYMGTFQSLQNSLARVVFRSVEAPEAQLRILQAVNKIISFEQQTVLEVYDAEYQSNLKKEYEIGRDDLRATIADVGTRLTDLSAQTHQTVKELVHHFHLIKASSQDSSRETELVSQQAEAGKTQFQRLFAEVREAGQAIRDMEKMVGRFEEASRQIGKVTVLVKNISEQTHILSLNSAIEAARAGESGKGFTVVSEEIRKLADETNQAMAQISDLVTVSSHVTADVVHAIEKVTGTIEKGVQESETAGEKFKDIISSAQKSHALSSGIDQKMDLLGRVTQELETGAETMRASMEQLKHAL